MQKLFSVIFLLILFGCQSSDDNTNDPFDLLTQFVDRYSEEIIQQANVNSMSVAVYSDGNTYHNYYGAIDPDGKMLPNDSTLFEIASITKVFTGSLVARAVVEKKLSLDTDIREYLAEDYPNLEYEGQPVTVQHLVTHTLGFATPPQLDSIYDKVFSGYYGDRPIDYNMDDLLDELKTVELSHAPGTFYDYNNVGPDIAAYILQQIYQKPYQDLLADFLKEIGMEDTYLQQFAKHKNRLIKGYTESGKLATVTQNPLLGGSAGIITTLPDLAKFMQYQLESNQAFIKESTRSLFQNEEENLGYLWDVGFAEVEGFYYLKTGTSSGIQSVILLCPGSNYGQILLVNNTSEEATNDWLRLYNRIEYDLIRYPKINLWSKLETLFLQDQQEAFNQYRELSKDTTQYFSSSGYLNRVGYNFLFQDQIKSAIGVFELAISVDPENANLYDSLGEVYFKAKDYEKSKQNFEKSLTLKPNNKGAEKYINEINQILSKGG